MERADHTTLVLAVLARNEEGTATPLAVLGEQVGLSTERLGDQMELVGIVEELRTDGFVEVRNDTSEITLTAEGRSRALAARQDLAEVEIAVAGEERVTLSVADAAERLDSSLVGVAAAVTDDGVYYVEDTPPDRIVGRDAERERCRRLLDRIVEDGDGRALFLAGQGGVGKTSLAEAVLEDALSAGVDVVSTRCGGSDGEPYGPIREALATLDDAADVRLDGGVVTDAEQFQAEQNALFHDFTARLRPAATEPARVLFVDDLHLADAGTLSYVEYLLDHLAGTDLLIVGSYRPTELSERSVTDLPTPGGADHGTDGDVTVLDLSPLDERATGEVIEQTVGHHGAPAPFVTAIQDVTGGNPLFVEETVTHLLETGRLDPRFDWSPGDPGDLAVPDTVQEMVAERIAALDDDVRTVLEWAALVGDRVPLGVLRRLLAESHPGVRSTVDVLVGAGLLSEIDDRTVEFENEIARKALLADLPADQRRTRHTAIARAYESEYTPEDDVEAADTWESAATVASHYERGGEYEAAVSWYRRGADRAMAVYADAAALEYLEDALALAREHGGAELLVELALETADVHETVAEFDDANRYAQFARERAETDDHRCLALFHLGRVSTGRGDHERAVELVEEALALRDVEDELTGRLLGVKCDAQIELGRFDDAVAVGERRRRLAESLDDDTQLAASVTTLGDIAHRQGQVDRAQEHYERSLAINREVDDHRGVANSLHRLGIVATGRSEYDRARGYHEEGLDHFREIGDRFGVAKSLLALGNAAKGQGEPERAGEHYEESLAAFRAVGARHAVAATLNNLGLVAHRRGDLEEALEHYEESLEIKRDVGDRPRVAAALNNLGEVARDQGDYERAREYYEQSLEISRDIGETHRIAMGYDNLGRIARVQGNAASAREYYEKSLAAYRETEDRRRVARVLLELGGIAADRTEHDRARDLLEEAAEIAADVGNDPILAGARARLAAVAFAAGDVERGVRTGDRAFGLIESGKLVTEDQPPVEEFRAAVEAASEAGRESRAREWCRLARDAIERTPGVETEQSIWFVQWLGEP